MSVTIEYNVITPSDAERMLAKNIHNRPLRPTRVAQLSEDIIQDRWADTGEAIKFSTDGVLLDGQHRLAAIIQAGRPVRLAVVRGLAPDAQEVMDSGLPRQVSDILSLRGEQMTSTAAAVARQIAASGPEGKVYSFQQPSRAAIIEAFDTYTEEIKMAVEVSRGAHRAGITASMTGYLYFVLARIDREDADAFFDRLIDGQNLTEGHPVYALRRWIDNTRTANRSRSVGSSGAQRRMFAAVTFKAWNAYRSGRDVYQLRWTTGGSTPEVFPVPR